MNWMYEKNCPDGTHVWKKEPTDGEKDVFVCSNPDCMTYARLKDGKYTILICAEEGCEQHAILTDTEHRWVCDDHFTGVYIL